jgi:hypothetical protein
MGRGYGKARFSEALILGMIFENQNDQAHKMDCKKY